MVFANSRISLSTVALAIGCNALLGNEEGILADATGGRSGSAGAGGPPAQSNGGEPAGDGGNPAASGSGGEVSAEAGAPGSGASAGNSEEPPASGGMSDGSGGVSMGGSSAAGSGNATSGDAGAGGNSGTGGGAPCACTPGATVQDQIACDPCGTATVTKACQQDCQWSDYGPPGTCVMPTGACVPGTAPTTRVAPCANGGWKNQTQSCTDACTLGPWVDAGACEYPPNPCTGCACVSWCEDDDTGGTTCLWIACSEAEGRAECQADSNTKCGGVTAPLTFKDWRPM